MKEKTEKPGFFERLATFIVDKRNLFFLIFIFGIIFSVIAQGWVSVNNDITAYLPEETETRKGLTVMEDEFTTYGTVRMMISNITYPQAAALVPKIEAIEGISSVAFDETSDHFQNSAAMFDITFDGEAEDEISIKALDELKTRFADYDFYESGEVGNNLSDTLGEEMNVIFLIAVIIIVLVLLFTSRTYAEIPVLLMTFGAAALLNKGTNFLFGEISFITDSVAVVLQLALAIDYAIILCHRYSEERETLAPREACIQALSKAIPEISSSSLTTISGLLAMMFMQFKIGADLGVVLIKAIFFSLLSVFTLMPGLLMLLNKWIDKTHHRNFVPNITPWGKIVTKLRFVIVPLFVPLLLLGFHFSNHCPYAYGESLLETEKKNEAQIAEEMIEKNFGDTNVMAVMVPIGDYEKEGALLRELESCSEVDYALGLANTEAQDGYILTDKLTPRQFAELLDQDVEVGRLLYTAYAVKHENYGQIVSNIDNYRVPLIDMFLFLYDQKQEGYVSLEEDVSKELDDLHKQLTDAKAQLQGEHYTRLLVNLNLPEEGEETFAFLDKVHDIVRKYYGEGFLLAGNSTNASDLSSSFSRDNIIISVLSILFVIIVLLFTFKSAGLPVLLVLVIEDSIWMNFTFPYLHGTPIHFLGYLIVSSIQMGANIDYAIVISNRYLELKKVMERRAAMVETLNQSFPTIVTSGGILASAGILISKLTSNPVIYAIGQCLGRGTIISIILVMAVLPGIMLLGDSIIERTAFQMKTPQPIRLGSGKIYLDGRVRGQISGRVDAEVHGVLYGDIAASVDMDTMKQQKEVAADEQ